MPICKRIDAVAHAAIVWAADTVVEQHLRSQIDEYSRRALVRAELVTKVFIDDFGTGYSSLAYLHALPVDGIKIDKSLINALTSGSEVNAIVPHIIGIAHERKLAMVAPAAHSCAGVEENAAKAA